jgi:hypothetical protein
LCNEKKEQTYESSEADPVRVHFSARAALHLEGVVVWLFLGVLGAKLRDPMFPVNHMKVVSILLEQEALHGPVQWKAFVVTSRKPHVIAWPVVPSVTLPE